MYSDSEELFYIIYQNDLELFKKKIKSHDPFYLNYFGENVLMVAALQSDPSILKFLCETLLFKDKMDDKDNNGYTALHLAIKHGRINDNIRILIKYGASLHILTGKGDTLIDLYCFENNAIPIDDSLVYQLFRPNTPVTILTMVYLYKIQMVSLAYVEKYIIDFVTDINYSYKDYSHLNCTALHLACEYDLFEVCQLLIKYNCDVNHIGRFGMTPIFYASSNEIAQLLIDHNADRGIQNNDNIIQLKKIVVLHCIRHGIITDFSKIHRCLVQDEDIKKEISWATRKHYISLYKGVDSSTVSNSDEKHIHVYLLNDLAIREICEFIGYFPSKLPKIAKILR